MQKVKKDDILLAKRRDIKVRVVYDKFFTLLKERNITQKDIKEKIGVGNSVFDKLRSNGCITTDTIGKICNYLHVQPSDIMDVLYDGVSYEEYEKQQKIAELEAQLAKLKKE